MEPIARDIQHFSHGQHYFRGAGGGQEGVGRKTLRAFGFPVKRRMARAGMTYREEVGGWVWEEGILSWASRYTLWQEWDDTPRIYKSRHEQTYKVRRKGVL